MLSSLFSSAGRRLALFALACMAAALAACGGGSGAASAVTLAGPGALDSQPWKAVFNGANSLSFNATDCSGLAGAAATAVLTLTRGTNTFTASLVSGSATLGPVSLGSDTEPSRYNLNIGTGDNNNLTLVASVPGQANLQISNNSGITQTLSMSATGAGRIYCNTVTNPLVRSQINLQPAPRMASLLASMPMTTFSSTALGCFSPAGGTYSYAISPQGEVQFDGVPLAANWLETLTNSSAFYSEVGETMSLTQRETAVLIAIRLGIYIRVIASTSADTTTIKHECNPVLIL